MKAAKITKLKTKRPASKAEATGADRYSALFSEASDAIMVVDLTTGHIQEANRRMQELTGFVATELEGAELNQLLPTATAKVQRATPLSLDLVVHGGFHEDVVLARKDGILSFVSMSVRIINLEGRAVSMCILRDVSEKKSMERELITKHNELRSAYVRLEKANEELCVMQETLVQSGKLAALGELAAGIAHELNQPLTAIRGFAQEAEAVLMGQPQMTAFSEADARALKDYLNEIKKGSEKMGRIISHLRGFTRKSTEDYRWVDVHEVIEEALKMLDQQFRSRGIQVIKKFNPELAKIYANPFQLEQVFINFATNARDAIESKKEARGVITISTELVTSVGGAASQGRSVEMIQIRFQDNGIGISDAVKSKIFNPFFTTKEVGRGMGLGLSITYGILSKLNASVFVESKPGEGTVFTVRIPIDYRTV